MSAVFFYSDQLNETLRLPDPHSLFFSRMVCYARMQMWFSLDKDHSCFQWRLKERKIEMILLPSFVLFSSHFFCGEYAGRITGL